MPAKKPFFDHAVETKTEPFPESSFTSGLFVPEDEEQNIKHDDDDYKLFQSQIFAMFSEITFDGARRLFREFRDQPNTLMQSANAYLDHPEKYEELTPPLPSTGSLKREPDAENEYPNKKHKQDEVDTSGLWSKYIGNMTVESWCTRSIFSGLERGSSLSFSKNPDNDKIIYVNRVDPMYPDRVREIGRCNEDAAKFLAPLLETGYISMEASITYMPDTRLRTGDSFFIRVDCFLNSTIFNCEDPEDDVNIAASLKAVQNREDNFETISASNRRLCLSMMFDKLRLKSPTFDENGAPTEEDAKDTNEDDESFDELKKNYNMAQQSQEDQEEGGTLNLNQLKDLYKTAQSGTFDDSLPETYPSDFKLTLRPYQRNGLTWMLKREREYKLIGLNNSEVTEESRESFATEISKKEGIANPLWKEYKWPKDKSLRNKLDSNPAFQYTRTEETFFFNLYTGACAFEKPMIRSSCTGGILADEMGLGKTITTLSLVLTCPSDTTYVKKAVYDDYAHQTTLIILPMALLSQWESEFYKASGDSKKKCYIYYGNDTLGDLRTLLSDNPHAPTVVLTTYGTVQSEWSRLTRTGNKIGLFSVKFFRVILDEGHNIRNRAAKTTKAIYALESSRKWILTGTPIINRLDDFYSLINFLELKPWSQYSLWKYLITTPFDTGNDLTQAFGLLKTILDPILLRRTKNQRDKSGNLLVTLPQKEVIIERLRFNEKEEALYSWLKARAINTFTENMKTGTLLVNYTSILTHLLRLRQVCCHMDLIKTTDAEVLSEEGDTKTDQRLVQGKEDEVLKILRDLEESEEKEKMSVEDMVVLKNEIYETYPNFDDIECAICTSPIEISSCAITECKHCFCLDCLMEHFNFQAKHQTPEQQDGENEPDNVDESLKPSASIVSCPICRHEIKKCRLFRTILPHFKNSLEADNGSTDPDNVPFLTQADPNKSAGTERNYFVRPFSPYGKSSKINALLSHLHEIKQDSPNDHIIVFSQFTSFLDIIDTELSKFKKDFNVYKFDGRLNIQQRQNVLNAFTTPTTDSKITILLLSLKAGGVGLNLTIASKAFLLDPHWNNAIEFQAIDRLHRVGQVNNVKVVRFIMENSIEERMLKIQERKNQLGEALSLNEEERRKRRIEEIEILFAG